MPAEKMAISGCISIVQVGISVVDLMGREILRGILPDILNQTMPIPTGNIAPGLYIIRLQISKKHYATKVYLSP